MIVRIATVAAVAAAFLVPAGQAQADICAYVDERNLTIYIGWRNAANAASASPDVLETRTPASGCIPF